MAPIKCAVNMNFLINLSLFLLNCIVSCHGFAYEYVTCGSALKLLNVNYQVRLHSHEVKYGSGSGQQSVTAIEATDDVNSHWAIIGKIGQHCERGVPIACGSIIRLQHVTSGLYLHSHLFSAPLSNGQEVSCFGEEGSGDTGDHWKVVCDGKHWRREDEVSFRHVDTNTYLSVSGEVYGRPINGQMEVCAVSNPDYTTSWEASEGVYIKPVEPITEQIRRHDPSEF